MIANCYAPPELFHFLFSSGNGSEVCNFVLRVPVSLQHITWSTYFVIFLLTCLMEAPIYWYLIGRRLPPAKKIFSILLMNIATHPIVTWGFPWLFFRLQGRTGVSVLASEIFAPTIEFLILALAFKITWRRAFTAAFLANLFSWWCGIYIALLLGLTN